MQERLAQLLSLKDSYFQSRARCGRLATLCKKHVAEIKAELSNGHDAATKGELAKDVKKYEQAYRQNVRKYMALSREIDNTATDIDNLLAGRQVDMSLSDAELVNDIGGIDTD